MYFELDQDKFIVEGGLHFVAVEMASGQVESVVQSGMCSDVF